MVAEIKNESLVRVQINGGIVMLIVQVHCLSNAN